MPKIPVANMMQACQSLLPLTHLLSAYRVGVRMVEVMQSRNILKTTLNLQKEYKLKCLTTIC